MRCRRGGAGRRAGGISQEGRRRPNEEVQQQVTGWEMKILTEKARSDEGEDLKMLKDRRLESAE